MLDKVINSNVRFLENHGVKMGSDDKKAVYRYGLQILYYYVIDLVVIFSLAYLFGKLYETAIMTLTFGLLQVFGGGYHAKTPLKCLLTMLVGVAVGNVLITVLAGQMVLNVVAAIVFAGIILAVPPITDIRHPVGKKVKQRSKAIVRLILILLMIGVVLGSYLERNVEVAAVTITMGLYLISLVAAKAK